MDNNYSISSSRALPANRRTVILAIHLGFNTPKYFYKVFRQAMGTTPRKYRLAQIAKLREAEDAQAKDQQ